MGLELSDQPYQLLPALTPEEYDALREDIRAVGIRVPIDVDEKGVILNGHHRKAIADELGIKCPVRIVTGLSDEAKRQHALAVNLHGRRLTRQQRRELIERELKRDPSVADRAIARLMGVDHKTVGKVRRELFGGENPQYEPPFGTLGPFEVHPGIDLFPWVDDELFKSIVHSIKQNGLRRPIVITHDERTLVDGRIRYLACHHAGVEPTYERLPVYYTNEDIIDLIISENLVRSHYTPEVLAEAKRKLEALTAARQEAESAGRYKENGPRAAEPSTGSTAQGAEPGQQVGPRPAYRKRRRAAGADAGASAATDAG